MNTFARLANTAGLTIANLSELLSIPTERASKYVDGEIQPSSRELHVLKGFTLASMIVRDAPSSLKKDASLKKVTLIQKASNQPGLAISARPPAATKRAAVSMQPRKRTGPSLTTLELCAGGGGAALGLEQAGFAPLALLDLDPHACATLRRNRPYWNVIQADMRRFDASYWRGADLLSGGLPCPPFSIAGKQLGADDDRDMFPSMLRIVNEVQPRAVLIENVRGILTGKFAPFRAKIDASLSKQGFETYWMGFNAAEFGVPQNRFRAFLIALRRGETKPLRWPIPMLKTAPSVADTIADLMGSRGWNQLSSWRKRANAPAPTIVGGSHKHGGPDLGPTRARREWAELGVDGLGIADAPPAKDFEGAPRLTIPMVARLQTFPDDWIFSGSKTHAYRQVGNALPVGLAAAMAKAVRECLA
jgi:DNA (cytosine-5)-methyltransferase 1